MAILRSALIDAGAKPGAFLATAEGRLVRNIVLA